MVTNEEFKKLSSTETAKEAWTILQTTYEGTKAVKDSKLQSLTTSFEEIKMGEDKSFDEFYAQLNDIVNFAFNLRETIPKPKIVRKVLKYLPERFHAKITTIEESKDIDQIPLTELIGNLQTYELGLSRIRKSSKSKSMALKAKSSDIDESSYDEDSKMKSYITKQFKKFIKNANAKGFDKDWKQSNSFMSNLKNGSQLFFFGVNILPSLEVWRNDTSPQTWMEKIFSPLNIHLTKIHFNYKCNV